MIITFLGKKQSGKSTAAKYIAGKVMKYHGIIKDFSIQGTDLIITTDVDINGTISKETFPFDLKNHEYEFIQYASRRIFPFVKIFSFADPLKEFIHRMFGVPWECLYGTDEQKNSPTKVEWDNILKLLPASLKKQYVDKKGKKATSRELMQVFGSEICRTLYEDCHAEACFSQVLVDNPDLGLVDDGRFPNELTHAKRHGKTVKLDRTVDPGDHMSETSLNEVSNDQYDYVVPDCTIEEKHLYLDKMLVQFGLEYLV